MIKRIYLKIKTLRKAFIVAILTNAMIGAGDIAVSMLFLTGKMAFLYRISPTFAHEIGATGSFYFLSHGIIKLLLSWNLLHEKLWAYPAAIIFFAVFSVSQIIALFAHFSGFVLILFVVNFVVLTMVWLEYQGVRGILRTKE